MDQSTNWFRGHSLFMLYLHWVISRAIVFQCMMELKGMNYKNPTALRNELNVANETQFTTNWLRKQIVTILEFYIHCSSPHT